MHLKNYFHKLSKEQKYELMDYTRTEEGEKCKKLNFKLDRNKKGRPHKIKANNRSSDRNWKSKFCKVIKKDQGFKCIMSIMITED